MFNYQEALQSGYNDDEILNFLSEKNPNFDVSKAIESGYSPEEISEFISQPKEKGLGEKSARLAGQFGLGLAESASFPAEMYLASATSKGNQSTNIRNEIMKDIEWLAEKKMFGNATPEDESRLSELQELYKNPEAIEGMTTDFGELTVRKGLEKATGVDLKPEGYLEEAANIIGFIKQPQKLLKAGINPSSIIKGIAPTGKEALKGMGMALGLEIAKDGDYGPVGTIAAMVAGDVAASGASGTLKALAKPKEMLASIIGRNAVKKEAKELQKDLIKSFREEGMQADIGTITNNNFLQNLQTKLSQSGLTGKKLEEFKNSMFNDIKAQYEDVAKGLGKAKFANNFEAGNALKEAVEANRKSELDTIREFYESARFKAPDMGAANVSRLARSVESIEDSLRSGAIKSSSQKEVLGLIDSLKSDIYNEFGELKDASVKALMNNKIALNDIINYEVQGGAKQLLKGVVNEIDRSIIKYGMEYDKSFLNDYLQANKRFSEHAKTFRNKSISGLLKEQDPEKIFRKMDTIDGFEKIEKSLNKSEEGRRLFNDLKRRKLDDLFHKTMVNNVEEQLKLGTFSNILKDPKKAEIAKKLLGKEAFGRIKRITGNAGALQKSAEKFLNPSKSGVVAVDTALIGKFLSDIGHLLHGNPFPLARTGGVFAGSRKLADYFSDPQFLKLVEDIILADAKGNVVEMSEIANRLLPYAKEAYQNQSE